MYRWGVGLRVMGSVGARVVRVRVRGRVRARVGVRVRVWARIRARDRIRVTKYG